MAGIKAICGVQGDKAVIYQWLNQEGYLYPGAVHPYGMKMMNEYAFNMLKPLLEAQPYVQEFKQWQGEKAHVDLDMHRQVKNHMPYGNIVTWQAMVYAEMTPRFWEPWLEITLDLDLPVPMPTIGKIVINRTQRYHNQWIDYFFLKEYRDQLYFVGTKEEHEIFQTDWGIELPYEPVLNFRHLAMILKTCKLFIGNQSMCFAIAEGLKVPRILEVCDQAPNVIPAGEGGYYTRNPDTFKYLVEKLLK
jgi:hypothetical protein